MKIKMYKNESKYLNSYLDTNKKRGIGNGYTPSTFISFKCSKHNASYQTNKLIYSLKSRKDVFPFLSSMNCTAYYPNEMLQDEKIKKYATKIKVLLVLEKMSSLNITIEQMKNLKKEILNEK